MKHLNAQIRRNDPQINQNPGGDKKRKGEHGQHYDYGESHFPEFPPAVMKPDQTNDDEPKGNIECKKLTP